VVYFYALQCTTEKKSRAMPTCSHRIDLQT
jgi:hypothetical protein